MSFMLGSFTSGLFGGASSMLQLAGQYQNFQDRKAQIDAADEWKKTKDAQTSLDAANRAAPVSDTNLGTVDYSDPSGAAGGGGAGVEDKPTKTDFDEKPAPKPSPIWDDQWDVGGAARKTEQVVNPAGALGAPVPSEVRDADGNVISREPSTAQPSTAQPPAPGPSTPPPNMRTGAAQPSQVSQPPAPTITRPGTPPNMRTGGTMPPSPPYVANRAIGAPQPPPPPDVPNPSQMIGAPQPPPPVSLRPPSQITNQPVGSTITAPQMTPPPRPNTAPTITNRPIGSTITGDAGTNPVTNAFQNLFGIKSAAAAETGYGAAGGPPGGVNAPQPGQPAPPAQGLQTGAQDFSPEPGSAVTRAPEPQGGVVQAASTARAANPAQARAQQQTEQPAPGGGPTSVAMPGKVAPVAPGQTGPTLQSQPTPPIIKAAVPTNAYNGLSSDIRQEVDQAAQELHVSPYRLAVVGKHESNFNPNAKNPNSSASGVGQFITSTRQQMEQPEHGGPLGNSRADQIRLMARYVDYNDRIFGKDSAGSFMGYRAGPEVARQFATNFDAMAKAHPDWLRDVESQMGRRLTQADFTKGDLADPKGLVAAASQGPNQFLQFIAQTGNPGMQMYDRWQQAETSLVYAALRRGDYAGAAHARDLVFGMSHQGMFENTMQAHAQLVAGDMAGAAKSLARANAFFPDGAMGQFGVDGKGQLWAQRVDEHDPSRKIGGAFQVTPEKLTNLLAMTRDPKDYMKYVQEQQKFAETERHNKASEGLIHEGHVVTQQDAQARIAETGAYREGQLERQGAKDASGENMAAARTANKLINDFYGAKAQPMMADGVTPMDENQKGIASQAFSDIFHSAGGKVAGAEVQRRANGLLHGTMELKPTTTGYYAVVEKGTTLPLGYVSAETGDLIKGAVVPKAPNAPTSQKVH